MSDREVARLAREYVTLLGGADEARRVVKHTAREEIDKARRIARLADQRMDAKMAAESAFRSGRATDIEHRLLVAIDRLEVAVN